MSTNRTIRLKTSDGEIIETDIAIAKCSGTIRNMLEGCDAEHNVDAVVPLSKVSSAILRLFIKWAEHHKNDPVPLEDDIDVERRTDDISPWDADFVKVDHGTLFELVLAANFLDTKGLLDLSCKAVANMMKGKTAEEIRETFSIQSDFTADEEEELRREHAWCEEKR